MLNFSFVFISFRYFFFKYRVWFHDGLNNCGFPCTVLANGYIPVVEMNNVAATRYAVASPSVLTNVCLFLGALGVAIQLYNQILGHMSD